MRAGANNRSDQRLRDQPIDRMCMITCQMIRCDVRHGPNAECRRPQPHITIPFLHAIPHANLEICVILATLEERKSLFTRILEFPIVVTWWNSQVSNPVPPSDPRVTTDQFLAAIVTFRHKVRRTMALHPRRSPSTVAEPTVFTPRDRQSRGSRHVQRWLMRWPSRDGGEHQHQCKLPTARSGPAKRGVTCVRKQ